MALHLAAFARSLGNKAAKAMDRQSSPAAYAYYRYGEGGAHSS
jgi:hypothetical protein